MYLNTTQISKDKKIQDAFIDRITDVIRLNNTLISLEPLVYSPLEFETMKKEKRDFILTIEEEGIEIYDARSTKMA